MNYIYYKLNVNLIQFDVELHKTLSFSHQISTDFLKLVF